MSTILNALRKLQEEREEKTSIDDLGRSVATSPRQRRRGRRLLPVLLVLVLLAAGGGAFVMYAPADELLARLASYLESAPSEAPESEVALADARERQAVQQARPPATPRTRPIRPRGIDSRAASEGEPAMGAPAVTPPPSEPAPAPAAPVPAPTASVVEQPAAPPVAPPAPATPPPAASRPAPEPTRAEPPETPVAEAAARAPAPAPKPPIAKASPKPPARSAPKPTPPRAPDYEDEMAAAAALPFPKIVIERLRWHPDPSRREVRMQLEQAGPLVAREGDIVAGVLVRRIEPDAVEVQVGAARRLIPLVP